MGDKLVLEPTSQHSSEEAFEEAVRLVEMSAAISPYVGKDMPFVITMFKEFLHWLYSKQGEHQTPTELLKELADEMREGGMLPMPTMKGTEGKTND